MRNLYAQVTCNILRELQTGTLPWRKPWSATPGANVPHNAITRHEYNGINRVLLLIHAKKNWPTPLFLTFKQALELGGHVRKGEHGIHICKIVDWTPKDADPDDDRRVRTLKSYVVFNIQQCEGLPAAIMQ